MSTNAKTWITLVIVVVLLIIGLLIWGGNKSDDSMSGAQEDEVQTTQSSSTSQTGDTGLSTSPSDSSNAALQQDLNSVDTQINNLNTDLSATTTQSVY